ncbi:MAG: pantoate--beta-alanine ligase [Flavisolibacter sp.]|nr:pantoate--beta-alanine ligase [Flavisolibacter sp.]
MIIFKKADLLSGYLSQLKEQKKTIGFVPTMGALHQGHFALINAAKKEKHFVVCSIFINPTQFNNPEDLKHYPVTIVKDIQGLVEAKCNVLFLPDIKEIYPDNYKKKYYRLGKLETILEGEYRPGHFQGVCQVMDRLLQIVQPDTLYLGQKDYQQCMVITKLLQLLEKKQVQIEIVPTIREEDGLAMSSRNLRLNEEQRKKATTLYKALNFIKSNQRKYPITTLEERAKQQLINNGFTVDYVHIADRSSLKKATSKNKHPVALVAASLDGIRLIDNLLL